MVREHILDPIENHDFEFSVGWFAGRNLKTFQQHVLPEFKDLPTVYLELGVFEGMSMAWMLQNVLTHPASRAIGVDPWLMMPKRDTASMEAVRKRALKNLSPWTTAGKCELYRSTSAEFLDTVLKRGVAGLTKNSVDLCLIDGSHWAPFVYYDAIRVYELLCEPKDSTPGGLMMFDDVENDLEKTDHVQEGINMFVDSMTEGGIVIEWKHKYMESWRKVEKTGVIR